jgi:hypothetical protein
MLAGVWCTVIGFVGVIMTGLWALTEHVATYRNENLLQANLLILPLALLAPRLAAGAAWAARPAELLAAAVALLSAAGLALQALPGFSQSNGEIVALMVPANIGLWLGVRALAACATQRQSAIVSPSAAASTTRPGAAPAA